MKRATTILALAAAPLLAASALAAGPRDAPARKHSTTTRLTLPRLAAAHADVLALRARRLPVILRTGLADYRAILHAHAEDSDHTGGTRPEMLAAAKRAGVSAIFLSDHARPPRDFMDSWRGLRDGVLFIPGSEAKGFLLHPEASVMDALDGPKQALIERTTRGDGLIFLSHVEERRDHPMDGLTGMEVYNRHADAMDDVAALFALVRRMTDPEELPKLQEALRLYPDEVLASQIDYPTVYMSKWDAETARGRRVVGIAAADCHHNQIMIVKKLDDETVLVGTNVDTDDEMRKVNAAIAPGIRELVKGHAPGDEIVRLDFDPYHVFFRDVCTHILAPELTERAMRRALRAGHAYVSHDWMADPTGLAFVAHRDGRRVAIMGDEVRGARGLTLRAELPVPAHIELVRDGERIRQLDEVRTLEHPVDRPGVYRLEAWLEIDGELRPWVYTNPIYVRPGPARLGPF